MKKVTIAILLIFLPSLGFTSNDINADNNDITVSFCSQDSDALLVDISGASAMLIYSNVAHRMNIAPKELGGVIVNDMHCRPTSIHSQIELQAIKCSFVMKNGKNIPYPQIDPAFSRSENINCD